MSNCSQWRSILSFPRGLTLLAAAFLIVSALVIGNMRSPTGHAPDNWRIDALNWTTTGSEEAHELPELGSTLQPGQRISTARGQNIELYIGENRISLGSSTVVIIGDDDPATEIGTFALAEGTIGVTVRKGNFATFGAPGLKATSSGADFKIATSDKGSEVSVLGGVVTVVSQEDGASTEVGANQVAIVGPNGLNKSTGKSDPIILPAARNAIPLTDRTSPAANDPDGPWAEARVADPTWVTSLISKGEAAPVWVVKGVTSSSDTTDAADPATGLPRIGTILKTGMQIATTAGQQVELTNGRDLLTLSPNTIATVGDSDPSTERMDFAILAGAIEVNVKGPMPNHAGPASDHAFQIYAPHLVLAIKTGNAAVSASNKESGVAVTAGAATVTSIGTGEAMTVEAGTMAIVRPKGSSEIRKLY